MSPSSDPAELIRRAVSLAQAAPLPRPAISERQAQECAKDAVMDLIHSIVDQIDSPMELVEADERLSHLTDAERRMVADLVDSARVTVTFAWHDEEESDE